MIYLIPKLQTRSALTRVKLGGGHNLSQLMAQPEEEKTDPEANSPASAPPTTNRQTDFLVQNQMNLQEERRLKFEDEEDNRAKQEMILKIEKYTSSERFGPILESVDTRCSSKMSVDDLRGTLDRIRCHLDGHHVDTFYNNLATGGAVALEKFLDPLYACKGFSKQLLGNDQFWTCFERYKIAHAFPNVPPYIQMMFIVSSTLLMSHQISLVQTPVQEEEDPSGESATVETPVDGSPPQLGGQL